MSYTREIDERDEWIRRAQEGDRTAEAKLFEAFMPEVNEKIYRWFGATEAITEDVLQEAMLGFLEAIRTCRKLSTFWYFANRCIYNSVRRHLMGERKRRRPDSGAAVIPLDVLGDVPEEAPDRDDAPSRRLPSLDCLDDRQRKAIEMKFGLDGPECSIKEIAAELGVGQRMAYTILESALEKLRTLSDSPR